MSVLAVQTAAILLVATPLFAALGAFARARIGTALGLLAVLVLLAASLTLAGFTLVHGATDIAIGGWAVPLGIAWQIDGLTAAMLLLSSCVMAGASIYRAAEGERRAPSFWPLWLFLWGGLNALFLSGDLFNLYVTLELVSLAAVALIATAGGNALAAAWRYFIATLLGSSVFLMGVALIYGQYGLLDLVRLGETMQAETFSLIGAVLITTGLLLKGAIFPLHFWLPAAHSRAPAAVSAALSGVVVASAFYLLARLWFGPFAPLLNEAVATTLGLLGAAAILWGGAMALVQRRLKMLIAYSTVSQLGYTLLLFPLAAASSALAAQAWAGAVTLLLSHGLAKAALFLSAGILIRTLARDRVEQVSRPGAGATQAWLAFVLGAASLVGLPPSGGFFAKWWMLQAALAAQAWFWTSIILVGSLLTALYLFRIFSGPLTEGPDPRTDRALGPMGSAALAMAIGAWIPGFIPMPLNDLLASAWSRP